QRVKKQNSAGEFTYYVNKFYEIENGTATSYFFRDAERIAKQTDEGMEWYLSDHLGSTTLLINESGLEVERTEYYPYGEVQSGGLEKYGFTGQENDADTGLMYYGARYYSPGYRVFVQPDMMLPDVYNPQALNRYSYVQDNPVKYIDPTGHHPVVAAVILAGAVGGGISFFAQLYDKGNLAQIDYREVGECALIASTGAAAAGIVIMAGPAVLEGTGLAVGQQQLITGATAGIVGSQVSTMTANELSSNNFYEGTILDGTYDGVAQDAIVGGFTEIVGSTIKQAKYIGKTRYPNTAAGISKLETDVTKKYSKYFVSSSFIHDFKKATEGYAESEIIGNIFEWVFELGSTDKEDENEDE
ncbi:MAG: hypothetical protein PWQ63_1572, partial [Methanolobus sp.]|nr:hypothetical protein [Methanolobus sp.]